MQFQIRTNEVFCSDCANDLAGALELQGVNEIVVEPVHVLDWVFCGKCRQRVYAEKRTA